MYLRRQQLMKYSIHRLKMYRNTRYSIISSFVSQYNIRLYLRYCQSLCLYICISIFIHMNSGNFKINSIRIVSLLSSSRINNWKTVGFGVCFVRFCIEVPTTHLVTRRRHRATTTILLPKSMNFFSRILWNKSVSRATINVFFIFFNRFISRYNITL